MAQHSSRNLLNSQWKISPHYLARFSTYLWSRPKIIDSVKKAKNILFSHAEKAILENFSNINLDQEQFSYLCQSNFRGFDKSVHRVFKNPILLDSVKYSEENLILTEREGRGFRVIDHLDGIRFYADIWH